jgi:predicted  nucleic acid-binding Zn-ribbon protein
MNAHILDSEKQLKQRLVDLHKERDEAHQAIEKARDEMITGQGKTAELVTAQSTFAALCEAVTEAERRAVQLQNEQSEKEKQAKRDKLQTEIEALSRDEKQVLEEIQQLVAKLYSELDSFTERFIAERDAGFERKAEIVRLKNQLGNETKSLFEESRETLLLEQLRPDKIRGERYAAGMNMIIERRIFENRHGWG